MCSINPVTNRREFHPLPRCIEEGIGGYYYRRMLKNETPISASDPVYGKLLPVIQRVGERLKRYCGAPHLPFEFTLLRRERVNASCLPGGKIVIHTGLILGMCQSERFGKMDLETRIAAVFAHEMGHAVGRHYNRSIGYFLLLSVLCWLTLSVVYSCSKVFFGYRWARVIEWIADKALFVLMVFDSFFKRRAHEFEADRYGMLLMEKAGYDPRAAIYLQRYFEDLTPQRSSSFWSDFKDLFSTHPKPRERIQENLKTLREIEAQRR